MGGRAQWNLSSKIKGPVGFLLARTHASAAFLSEDLVIKAHPSIIIDPLQCAKQHLKMHIDDLCTIALSKVVATTRTSYKALGTLDKTSYFKGVAKLPEDHREHYHHRRRRRLGEGPDSEGGQGICSSYCRRQG